MTFKGYYKVYEDGQLIGGGDNIITDRGKRALAEYIAGILPQWAGSVAVGIGTTTPTASDYKLAFEITRAPIKSKTVSYFQGTTGDHLIIVKSTLENETSGTFSEMGIFSSDRNGALGNYSSFMLSACDSTEFWQEYDGADWINISTTANTADAKNGIDAIAFSSTGTKNYRLAGLDISLEEFSSTDQIIFATKVTSGTLTSVEVRFNTDDTNYFSYTPAGFATGTYGIVSYPKSSWVATGSPSWETITSLEFRVTGTVDLIIDGIRIEEIDTINPDYVLVSRALPTYPVVKNPGSIMEIEYYLEI
jgi:hypothetical protein